VQRLDKGGLQLTENTLPGACCLFFFIWCLVKPTAACSPQNTDEGRAQMLGVDLRMCNMHIHRYPEHVDEGIPDEIAKH